MNLHVCPWWLSFILQNSLRRLLQNPEKILKAYVKEGQTAVDIGSGPGFFTIPMAKMVGESGRVIAADLQPEMLDKLRHYAERKGLSARIQFYQCEDSRIGIDEKADFILAMYMVHEVPDAANFLKEVAGILKPGGTFFLSEPKMHVNADDFQKTTKAAFDAGLKLVSEIKLPLSRTVLFTI